MEKRLVMISAASAAILGIGWFALAGGPTNGGGDAAGREVQMSATGGTPQGAKSPAERFETLDDYLRFLKKKSAMDVPYYRPVGPDTYEYVTGRGQKPPRPQFTRQELMEKFGFTK